MAVTQLSDAIVPEFYAEYGGINTMTSTALFESGVLVPNPIIDGQLGEGGDIFNVPAWLDLAAANDPGGAEPNLPNDNPATSATPKKITAANHVVRKSYLNDSWTSADFATELTGSDPQQRVAERLQAYWRRQYEYRLTKALYGILLDSVANHASDLVVDVSSATTGSPVAINGEAPAPSRPIERGLAGSALLAHVLVSKYSDHQPLYRQSEMYAREGVDLDRSTLAGWVGASSQLLAPLVDAMRKHVLSAQKIHADDTPVPVFAPGNGKTKTGRLWTYVRDERAAGEKTASAVWFAYSEDRRGEHPRRHLKDFKGALQVDAYAGFHHLYEGGSIYEVACWAHTRRKFHDIHTIHPSPITTEAIDRIGALYGIEEDIRGKPVDLRREVRLTRARPLIDNLRSWMESALRSLSKKSETAGALRYALAHWRALTRYLDDGLLEIDNNAAERALRCVALGRKNYLFAGSDSGGERAAALYSLIGSAKLNGLDPEFYLRTVLTRIPEHPISRITELLPWNLTPGLIDTSKAA